MVVEILETTTPLYEEDEVVLRVEKGQIMSKISDQPIPIKPVLGIEGGMGKEATIEFENLLIAAARVLGYEGDNGLITTKTDNELKPDRSPALLGEPGAESPVPKIIKGLIDLANSGCHLAVMPCNTAHGFINEIRDGSPIPVISLIEVLEQFLSQQKIKHVGLLATNGSVNSGKVFEPVFRKKGINISAPSPEVQQSVMDAIYDEHGVKQGFTKAGKRPREILEGPELHPTKRFKAAVTSMIKSVPKTEGIKYFIAGCTEVPLALEQSDMPKGTRLIDPMKLMALALVKIVHNEQFQGHIQNIQGQQEKLKEIEAELKTVNQIQNKKTANYEQLAQLSAQKDDIEKYLGETKKTTLELIHTILSEEKNRIKPEELEALEKERAAPARSPSNSDDERESRSEESSSMSADEEGPSFKDREDFVNDLAHCTIDLSATRRIKNGSEEVVRINYVVKDPDSAKEFGAASDAIQRMKTILIPAIKRIRDYSSKFRLSSHFGTSPRNSSSSSSESLSGTETSSSNENSPTGTPSPPPSPILRRLSEQKQRRWDVEIPRGAYEKFTGENAWVKRVIEERLQTQSVDSIVAITGT